MSDNSQTQSWVIDVHDLLDNWLEHVPGIKPSDVRYEYRIDLARHLVGKDSVSLRLTHRAGNGRTS